MDHTPAVGFRGPEWDLRSERDRSCACLRLRIETWTYMVDSARPLYGVRPRAILGADTGIELIVSGVGFWDAPIWRELRVDGVYCYCYCY